MLSISSFLYFNKMSLINKKSKSDEEEALSQSATQGGIFVYMCSDACKLLPSEVCLALSPFTCF